MREKKELGELRDGENPGEPGTWKTKNKRSKKSGGHRVQEK